MRSEDEGNPEQCSKKQHVQGRGMIFVNGSIEACSVQMSSALSTLHSIIILLESRVDDRNITYVILPSTGAVEGLTLHFYYKKLFHS